MLHLGRVIMTKLVLQGANLSSRIADTIAKQISAEVETTTNYTLLRSSQSVDKTVLQEWRQRYPIDINQIPENFDPTVTSLLVTDMDSTLINIECVDEIADFIGVKPQVAAITEAAMLGDIDFETSLRQRVSLLKGLDVTVLEQVFEQRLQLNPGAMLLIKALQTKGIKTALVSGGFTFFTDRLKAQLGLDYTMANVLQQHNGRLTGEVEGSICGAQAKADFLHARCQELAIKPEQTVAMGDGANDLLMMREAGLSVAYHAKPKVQQQAATALNHCGLDGVLGLLQL